MGSLATEIQSEFWDEHFYANIRDKVDLEIKPVVQELKDASESFINKISRGISKAVRISALPLIATVFPGLPHEVAIAAGAGAAAFEYYNESEKKDQINTNRSSLELPTTSFFRTFDIYIFCLTCCSR